LRVPLNVANGCELASKPNSQIFSMAGSEVETPEAKMTPVNEWKKAK
jgi:hypothetical protein